VERLREVVDGVLALCDEIRPDSVLGVNPGARLTLIRQVLTASGRGRAPAETAANPTIQEGPQ
jgi:hypothetical protein